MAVQLHTYIVPCVFILAIGTLLYISWTDITDALRFSTLPQAGAHFWGPTSSTPPTTEFNTTADPPDLTPIPILHRKNYTKLPQWDFEDLYRRDRPPSKTTQTCQNSLWSIINQDPELRKKFIPDIRMFVYNGSITMSEWNRLSHFNNPFGFMDYSHKDVLPALNLITKPKYPLLSPKPGRDCISCAVVANGGVLWRSKKGREIDSHDYVFRVNGAILNGFEDDVGNRTDVYVHTSFSLTQAEVNLKKYNYKGPPHDQGIKYVLLPEGMRDFEWLTALYKRQALTSGYYKNKSPWTHYSNQFNETHFYVLHMDFLRYIRNRFLRCPGLYGIRWAMPRPTNGAFMMFLALHLCDRVNAYGFMTEDYKDYSNYYYESGAKTKVIFYANHDYIMEKNLWKRLHKLKLINLFHGEAGQQDSVKGHLK